jgi:predicted nucleic-acid-binding protein
MLADKTVSKRTRGPDLSKVVINMLDDSSINVRLEPFLSNEVPSYIME